MLANVCAAAFMQIISVQLNAALFWKRRLHLHYCVEEAKDHQLVQYSLYAYR